MTTTFQKLIIALVVILNATLLFANNNPENTNTAVLTNTSVEVYAAENSQLISVTESDKNMRFVAKTTIAFIQLVNQDSEIEFQMPIGSDIVNLGLENFTSGNYEIKLLHEGSDEFSTTYLTIK